MDFQKKLSAKFSDKDIQWRIQQAGMGSNKVWAMALAYVDSRAVMDRLDSVFGIGGWQDTYEHRDNGVLCRLKCKVISEWITKEDGSPETQVEAFKGGISKALVRCAVKWGIGRYLYDLPVTFVNTSMEKQEGWNRASIKHDNKYVNYYWQRPVMPENFLPLYDERNLVLRIAESFDDDDIASFREFASNKKFKDWLSSASEYELNKFIEVFQKQ